ncbi:type II toxin-antitoxin system HicB family antitoxin [Cloacibacillus sp.]|uniref:type II toxin-antitoxin system HicB family antitoxin n=1 Tax=Cloacibacillus sp. TaxID=2049023 RepID=UPI0025BDDF5C|nr:type II toxin-antitoxin system HicB family antitoxin [Cloacibacillus sp.]MCC8056486.1 type II toxin-antitoxin system HicB family antitoxin [Cloacibacillus sp.]
MILIYPAIFHKEKNSYWAEFPDLVGCQSYGSDLKDAVINAQESLAAYALTILDEDKKLPVPSDIEKLETEEGFISLVTCNIKIGKNNKSIKKTLTIPEWLNDKAIAKNINFSKVLQDALIEKVI